MTLKAGHEPGREARGAARPRRGQIGPIAKPANIFTPELPKTRSGKIMRRLLRDVAENGRSATTALADPSVVDELRTAP